MMIGGEYEGNSTCLFRVWAPFSHSIEVKTSASPHDILIPLQKTDDSYWSCRSDRIPPGTCYVFRIDGRLERPDPASRFQPDGVHEPSQIIDHSSFHWTDSAWRGFDLDEAVLYELHVGTFSAGGTFDDIIPALTELNDLGVTAIELMPVAQFPGERNWGYDGTYPFAVQNSYGGPDGLKRLVNACHNKGIAVLLDVVYNHFGPEGCYVSDYGPYYTSRYKTPWGEAVNFDDALNDGVRNFFTENALYWLDRYHIDGLRLDAVHSIYDFSARPFLAELAREVDRYNRRTDRRCYVISESDLNDAKIVRSRELYGFGHDAQWNDDFHHAVHSLLTGERAGYYSDFGRVRQLEKALREGFVFTGQRSRFRQKDYGNSSRDIPANRFIVFVQNHDQVGNRMKGDRLSTLVSFEAQKLAAGLLFLSPYIPLLFMGEEYGEENPFLYFVSHADQSLLAAVQKGRREEFREFILSDEVPDPSGAITFFGSKLKRDQRNEGRHRVLYELYRTLIRMRKELPALAFRDKENLSVFSSDRDLFLYLERWHEGSRVFSLFNFNNRDLCPSMPLPQGRWKRIIDSSDRLWGGPGTHTADSITGDEQLLLGPRSFVLFEKRG